MFIRDGEREGEREMWCAATLQRYMIGTLPRLIDDDDVDDDDDQTEPSSAAPVFRFLLLRH